MAWESRQVLKASALVSAMLVVREKWAVPGSFVGPEWLFVLGWLFAPEGSVVPVGFVVWRRSDTETPTGNNWSLLQSVARRVGSRAA